MVKIFFDIEFIVIINLMKVVIEFGNKENILVILIGGILLVKLLLFVGLLVECLFEIYYVNKIFLLCKGFDINNGMSDLNEW